MVKLCNGDEYHALSLPLSRSLFLWMSALAFFASHLLLSQLFFSPFFQSLVHLTMPTTFFPCRLLVFLILLQPFEPLSPHTLISRHESSRASIHRSECTTTGYKINSKWDGWLHEWMTEWKRNDTNWWQLQTIASNYACYKPFYTFSSEWIII